jgi:uncharacterized damage-inducible protein DinB
MRYILSLAATCSLLCAPAIVLAQSAPGMVTPVMPSMTKSTNSDPAEVYGKLMSGLEGEIVGAAEAMPADKYDFAPTQGEFKGVRTFGSQVKHLAEANYGFFEGWNVPGAAKEEDIEKLKTKDEIVQALKDSYTYAHKALKTMTADNAFASLGEKKGTRAGSAAFCLAHSMDHYGQMVEYLRMNGIIPPASRKS